MYFNFSFAFGQFPEPCFKHFSLQFHNCSWENLLTFSFPDLLIPLDCYSHILLVDDFLSIPLPVSPNFFFLFALVSVFYTAKVICLLCTLKLPGKLLKSQCPSERLQDITSESLGRGGQPFENQNNSINYKPLKSRTVNKF